LKSPVPFEAAGLTGAVERPASRAVLEGAREELIFTLREPDRERNFLAVTTGGWTNERPRREASPVSPAPKPINAGVPLHRRPAPSDVRDPNGIRRLVNHGELVVIIVASAPPPRTIEVC